jgi:beta-lactamase superfamily II metal-dependent hydrolase
MASNRLKRLLAGTLVGLILATGYCSIARAGQTDGKLDVYFIDAEGGAATLIVTPAGESVLVDTGNRGDRDPQRIFAAAQAAGIERLNHVIVTHYHIDHFGGLARLATLMPIQHLHDNADENPTADRPSKEYLEAKVDDRSLLSPGDVLPLRQRADAPTLTIQCLAAHKKLIDAPASAKPNAFDKDSQPKAEDRSDNANSIVLLVSFGDFKFYDGGDLTWNMEHDLAAPVNRIGTVDVYQVTHHGLSLSNNPVLVKAIEPTVAIMNNGTVKGCEPEVFATLKSTPSIKAIFQLHKNLRPDGEVNNVEAKFIANTEKDCAGNLVHMAVSADAKHYVVSIPETKFEQTYDTKTSGQ